VFTGGARAIDRQSAITREPGLEFIVSVFRGYTNLWITSKRALLDTCWDRGYQVVC
jgi:hypothetical protein